MTLVEKLVRCYSPSGQEQEATRLLVSELADRGFEAQLDPAGNAVGMIGQGGRQIYLVGHLDTVSGQIPVRLENETLYGRGSVDAKGALAAFVEAAAAFENSSALKITVIGCVGEEASSPGARYLLANHKIPDYVIIGEPSGWEAITLGYKGSLSLEYALERPRHHRGMAQPTPAEEAVSFYRALCAATPELGTGFGSISIRLTDLNTGSAGSHESVSMKLNIRTPPGFNSDGFKMIAERLHGEAKMSWSKFTPAVLAAKRGPLVAAFLGAIRAPGGRPCFKYKTGTSDMNLLAAWGRPILTYGPGDSSLDHTPEEHLELAEYRQAIAVLRGALGRLEEIEP